MDLFTSGTMAKMLSYVMLTVRCVDWTGHWCESASPGFSHMEGLENFQEFYCAKSVAWFPTLRHGLRP